MTTTYPDDVLNEDWLRGNSWDIRLPNGQLARTLDEVARALGTTDIQKVAADLLRLPSGKAAPDDLKTEAVTFLAQLGAMAETGEDPVEEATETPAQEAVETGTEVKTDAVTEVKRGKLGAIGGDVKKAESSGIHIGGWWGAHGFSESLVVRDPTGRFVDRLGFGGIPETGSLGRVAGAAKPPTPHAGAAPAAAREIHLPPAPEAPKTPSVAAEARTSSFNRRIGRLRGPWPAVPLNASIAQGPIEQVRAPGRQRRAGARATARQSIEQSHALDAAIKDAPTSLKAPASRYRDAIRKGDEPGRAQAAQDLLGAIEANPTGSEDLAALVHPQDVPSVPAEAPPTELKPEVTKAPAVPEAPKPEAPKDKAPKPEAQHPAAGTDVNFPRPPEPHLAQGPIEGVTHTEGRTAPPATGEATDPIDVKGDLNAAIKLLSEGKHVRLHQPDEVSSMLDILAVMVDEASAKADKGDLKALKEINLCNVTVPGTNLFCTESKGIPRTQMPQLGGVPLPDTPAAAKLAANPSKKGEVDMTPEFLAALAASGINVEQKTVLASHLRASQNELAGDKVAGMTRAMRAGKVPEGAIFVTRDGYIIDGHHRWASKVAIDVADGKTGDISMPVQVLDMDIGEALDYANAFAKQQGIPQASMKNNPNGPAKGDIGQPVPKPEASKAPKSEAPSPYDHAHLGETTGMGSGTGGSLAAWRAREAAKPKEAYPGQARHDRLAKAPKANAAASQDNIAQMIADQQDLVGGITTTPANFDPLTADLSKAGNYDKGREVWLAATKGTDYPHEKAVREALIAVAKPDGIDFGKPVTGVNSAGHPWGSDYPAGHPRHDPAYDEYSEKLEGRLGKAAAGIGDTRTMYGSGDLTSTQMEGLNGDEIDTMRYTPERREAHRQIIESLMEGYKDVPTDREAIIMAGPPGSGKSTVIKLQGTAFGVNEGAKNFATINPDDMKDAIIKAGLLPSEYRTQYGLGDLESAALLHQESKHLKNLLRNRLYSEGHNVILDGTFGDPQGANETSKVNQLKAAGYQVTGVLVDGTMAQSLTNAGARHQAPPDHIGGPFTGRYVPTDAIAAQQVPPEREGVSPVTGKAYRTLSSLNFEEAAPLFDGGALWVNNDTHVPVITHSTHSDWGTEQQISQDMNHLERLLQYTDDVEKQMAIRRRLDALGVLSQKSDDEPQETKAARALPGRSLPSTNPGATKLREYWVHGEGAPKIRWGEPNDWYRCVDHLGKYVGERAKGLCTIYHEEALGGLAPGQEDKVPHPHLPGKKADTPPTQTTDQPKDDAGTEEPPDFTDCVMVALYPDEATARALAVKDGLTPEDLHVTLAFLGKVTDYQPADLDDLTSLVDNLALTLDPLTGTVNGVGKFNGDPEEGDPVYANIDVPGLDAIRVALVDALTADGFAVSETHGFTPHMTLRYDKGDEPLPKVTSQDVAFDFLSLAVGDDDVVDFPLASQPPPDQVPPPDQPVDKNSPVVDKNGPPEAPPEAAPLAPEAPAPAAQPESKGVELTMEYKALPINGFKVVDAGEGIVECIVSVTGIRDNVNDVIMPGAFTKTLQTRTPKGVYSHDWDKPIARTLSVRELLPGHKDLPHSLMGQTWPAEAGALVIKSQFNLGTERGRDALADVIFFGDEQNWSVGYNVPTGGSKTTSGVRYIKTMDLYEFSPVLFGAMPLAGTLSIKSAQQAWTAVKDVVGGQGGPTFDKPEGLGGRQMGNVVGRPTGTNQPFTVCPQHNDQPGEVRAKCMAMKVCALAGGEEKGATLGALTETKVLISPDELTLTDALWDDIPFTRPKS